MVNSLVAIGTVVLLKGTDKRVMIIGYYPVTVQQNMEITYEYCGCLFPEGVFDAKQSILFNNNDIEKIVYNGLVDQEQKDFIAKLSQVVIEEINKNNINTISQINNNSAQVDSSFSASQNSSSISHAIQPTIQETSNL